MLLEFAWVILPILGLIALRLSYEALAIWLFGATPVAAMLYAIGVGEWLHRKRELKYGTDRDPYRRRVFHDVEPKP